MRKFILLSVFVIGCAAFSFCQKTKYYIVFEENGKSGICDSLGKTLLQPEFSNIDILTENDIIVAEKNGKYGIFDADFKQIVPFNYDDIYRFLRYYNKNILVYRIGYKYGLLDYRKNKEITPPLYNDISPIKPFSSNLFSFEQNGKYGVINQKGKILIQPVFDDIGYNFSSNLLSAKKGGKYGFVNKKGKFVINPIFSFVFDFKEGKAVFCDSISQKRKCGIIDGKGDIIVKPIYDYIGNNNAEKNIYIIKQGDKYGVINDKMKLILEPVYDEISKDYREDADAFTAKKGNKYGFIDQNGKLFIDLKYDGAGVFIGGIAPVLLNGKWGLINLKDEVISDFKYIGWVESFKNGVAKYHKCSTSRIGYTCFQDGYIDKQGNIFIEPIYKGIEYLFGNKAIAVFNGSKYLIDIKTQEEIKKLKDDDSVFSIEP